MAIKKTPTWVLVVAALPAILTGVTALMGLLAAGREIPCGKSCLDGVRFHDLRHTGNTLAARSGVSTRDLMVRMGHDSVRAAITYLHVTAEADVRIAQALAVELSAADDDSSERENDPGDGAAA